MTVSDENGPSIVILLDIVNTIATMATGGLTVGGIIAAVSLQNIFDKLSAHIYLVTFGFILIISQAVVSMNATAGWARAFSYQNKRNIHLCMQILGAILAIAGGAMGMSARNSHNLVRSSHAIMGIISMVLVILSLIGGLVHAFARNLVPANITKIGHKLFGCITLAFVFITFMMGLEKVYTYEIFAIYISFGVIAILGILIPPGVHMFKR